MPVDKAVFVGCSLFIALKKPTFIVNLIAKVRVKVFASRVGKHPAFNIERPTSNERKIFGHRGAPPSEYPRLSSVVPQCGTKDGCPSAVKEKTLRLSACGN
jgi:hypothetical protein